MMLFYDDAKRQSGCLNHKKVMMMSGGLHEDSSSQIKNGG